MDTAIGDKVTDTFPEFVQAFDDEKIAGFKMLSVIVRGSLDIPFLLTDWLLILVAHTLLTMCIPTRPMNCEAG